jgi:hypothetical protein
MTETVMIVLERSYGPRSFSNPLTAFSRSILAGNEREKSLIVELTGTKERFS